jgi:hypothetical protein
MYPEEPIPAYLRPKKSKIVKATKLNLIFFASLCIFAEICVTKQNFVITQ